MDTSRVEDADTIAHGARLLLDGRDDEAARALATLPFDDPVPATRFVSTTGVTYEGAPTKGSLDNSDRIALYDRDGWRCRYCGRKVVVAGVLEILTSLSPGFRGLLPGHRMPSKSTEPGVSRVYPNVDHIQAVSRGGARLELHNHVTACTKCNEHKGNRSGWTPGPIEKDEWDGLVSLYRPLANRLEKVRAYHNDWFRDLKI